MKVPLVTNSEPVVVAVLSIANLAPGVVEPIPKFVPSNTKLAESVRAVAPELVKINLFAVNEDGVSVRAKKVEAPPLIPKYYVATHCVLVPLFCNTIPAVPALLKESFSEPVSVSAPFIYVLPITDNL